MRLKVWGIKNKRPQARNNGGQFVSSSERNKLTNIREEMLYFYQNLTATQTTICFSVDKKNQLDVTFCILYFSSNSCSTCFGQPCGRHQELTTA